MADTNESKVSEKFKLDLLPGWPLPLLKTFDLACTDLVAVLGGIPGWMQGLKIRVEAIVQLGLTSPGLVRLKPSGPSKWTVVYEFGHAWDFATGMALSRQLQRYTHSSSILAPLRLLYPDVPAFWYHAGSPPPPCGTDRNFTAMEDFAESLAAYVYPDRAKEKAKKSNYPYSSYGIASYFDTRRGKFIHDLIASGK